MGPVRTSTSAPASAERGPAARSQTRGVGVLPGLTNTRPRGPTGDRVRARAQAAPELWRKSADREGPGGSRPWAARRGGRLGAGSLSWSPMVPSWWPDGDLMVVWGAAVKPMAWALPGVGPAWPPRAVPRNVMDKGIVGLLGAVLPFGTVRSGDCLPCTAGAYANTPLTVSSPLASTVNVSTSAEQRRASFHASPELG